MKAKSPILALTPNNLDRVTGGCQLAVASPRAPKPSFGIPVEAPALGDSIAPLRDIASLDDRLGSLASDLLGEVDLGIANDAIAGVITDVTSALPPLWCGPTSGLDLGDEGDASAEMADIDDERDDDDDDDTDDEIVEEPATTTAPMFLDDDALADVSDATSDLRPAREELDRGEVTLGEPGSAWSFVDGPPPPSAPLHRGEEMDTTAAQAPAADTAAMEAPAAASSFFVQGPPPAIAPLRGQPVALAAAPSTFAGNIRDHRS